jgi:hypothetical protein
MSAGSGHPGAGSQEPAARARNLWLGADRKWAWKAGRSEVLAAGSLRLLRLPGRFGHPCLSCGPRNCTWSLSTTTVNRRGPPSMPRAELDVHNLRSWGRKLSRKVRETRSSGGLQGHEASRPLRSLPPDFPGLSSRHPGGSRRFVNRVLPATGLVDDAELPANQRRSPRVRRVDARQRPSGVASSTGSKTMSVPSTRFPCLSIRPFMAPCVKAAETRPGRPIPPLRSRPR